MARIIPKPTEDDKTRVFETEDGVKITVEKPRHSDEVIFEQVRDTPEKAFQLVASRIKKIEGISYDDDSPVKAVDLPADISYLLMAWYKEWRVEAIKKGSAVSVEEKEISLDC
jgi:hypothetical protein